jgi:hypothetical protein
VRVDWEGKMKGTKAEVLSSSYDYIITSSGGNGETSEWEKSLLKKYKIVNEWGHIPLAPFHNPRIIIYGKKT